MKKVFKYKKITSLLLLSIFVGLFLVSTKASAADQWVYTMKGSLAINGKTELELGPYISEAQCKQFQALVATTNIIKPCYLKVKDPSVPFDAQKGVSITSGTYTLLAPIGKLTSFTTDNIGDYLNMMFKLAIGLCAALAVIMIIISAVQYMGDESVFGKTEAKDKILNAILGLLIALGAYALLNTINPALTGTGGVAVGQVSAFLNPDSPNYQRNSTSGSHGKVTPMKWPTSQLHDMALAAVQSSGLVGLSPTDASTWFQTTTPTAENWVSLLAGMASSESSFIASQLTPEPLIKVDSSGKTATSVGLLQLSVEDCVNYGYPACTQTDLQGPNFNIKMGVAILKRLVKKDNIITGQKGSLWLGGARYWSVLRNK